MKYPYPIFGQGNPGSWSPEKSLKEKKVSKVIAAKTRVLFTRTEAPKETESGIILSMPQNEQNPLGYVHSIGSDVAIQGLEVGDGISVNWQSVGMMEHEGQKYYIVDQNNINAIVK